jgi:hypothetical protein
MVDGDVIVHRTEPVKVVALGDSVIETIPSFDRWISHATDAWRPTDYSYGQFSL